MQNLKKFYLLDEKIEQTVKKINDLQARYLSLQEENHGLLEKINDLHNQNRELSEQVKVLKAAREKIAGRSMDKEEIRKKIDRVLEKFGELQL